MTGVIGNVLRGTEVVIRNAIGVLNETANAYGAITIEGCIENPKGLEFRINYQLETDGRFINITITRFEHPRNLAYFSGGADGRQTKE